MKSIYQIIAEQQKKGEGCALCTIVDSKGSMPRHDTSKMIVFPKGNIYGSVGGGELENRVIQEALNSMADGKSRLAEYKLVSPQDGDPGICGGQAKIYIEPILPPPTLLVIGGGHVGKAVVHLAHWLGFRVVLADDRKEFSTPEAVPDADEYHHVSMTKLVDKVQVNDQTYIILTTRGLALDLDCVPQLIKTPAAFIGIIGSKRRWINAKKRLIEEGVNEDELAKINSPIGLDLGAETPEEIALSILAQVLMIKNKTTAKIMTL